MEEENKLEAIDYLRCRPQLNEMGFSDEQIKTALVEVGLNVNLLTDSYGCERGSKPYMKPYEFIRHGQVHAEEWKGEFKKEYTYNGDFYRVPSQYQSTKVGDLVMELFSKRYVWWNDFTIDKNYTESETGEWFDFMGRLDVDALPEKYLNMKVYEVRDLNIKKDLTKKKSAWSMYDIHDAEKYEVYLATEFGSLYVPIQAILKKDFSIVEKRMLDYFGDYYSGKGREEYYAKAIKALESEEAKLLSLFLNK
jgi:hypothetical protein